MNNITHAASSLFDLENQGATQDLLDRLVTHFDHCQGIPDEDYRPSFIHTSESVSECVDGFISMASVEDIHNALFELRHFKVTHEGYLYFGSKDCLPTVVAQLLQVFILIEPEEITWKMTFSSSTPELSVDGYSGGIILVTHQAWLADTVDEVYDQLRLISREYLDK